VSWAGLASTSFVFAYNSTEKRRMTHNIQRGYLSSPQKQELDPTLCQFPVDYIKTVLAKSPNQFCGLVGLKATGKTSTLLLVERQTPNVVYVELNSGSVCNALHENLKKSVYHLPWFLDQMRFDSYLSSKDIITRVFTDVMNNSKVPVNVFLDLNPTNRAKLPSVSSPSVGKLGPIDISFEVPSSDFDARPFIREVKDLVGSGVMRCLFAATEGLSFQQEAIREPRLRLFTAYELSIHTAVKYLQKDYNIVVNEEEEALLAQLPRSFASLDTFATVENKKIFIDKIFKDEKTKIMRTANIYSALMQSKYYFFQPSYFFPPSVKSIYQLALTRNIDLSDLPGFNLTEEQFLKLFVEPNIFTVTTEQSYKFQFDITAAAAKQYFHL